MTIDATQNLLRHTEPPNRRFIPQILAQNVAMDEPERNNYLEANTITHVNVPTNIMNSSTQSISVDASNLASNSTQIEANFATETQSPQSSIVDIIESNSESSALVCTSTDPCTSGLASGLSMAKIEPEPFIKLFDQNIEGILELFGEPATIIIDDECTMSFTKFPKPIIEPLLEPVLSMDCFVQKKEKDHFPKGFP